MKINRRLFLKGLFCSAAISAIPSFLSRWRKDRIYVKAKAFTWFGLRRPDGSAERPFKTIRAAMDEAEKHASRKTPVDIYVDAAVYSERLELFDYVNITGKKGTPPIILGNLKLKGKSDIRNLDIHGNLTTPSIEAKGCVLPVEYCSGKHLTIGPYQSFGHQAWVSKSIKSISPYISS